MNSSPEKIDSRFLMENNSKHLSKILSLVLRHKPETIALQLDANGWADTVELIRKLNAHGHSTDITLLNEVVITNDKQRFAFNDDKTKIRASQGHSIHVELGMQETVPPAILYHGTAEKSLLSILETGLQKSSRQHVHLSSTAETAQSVGSRHGKPVILIIQAGEMHKAGYKFYLSENKVWLTDAVPVAFCKQL